MVTSDDRPPEVHAPDRAGGEVGVGDLASAVLRRAQAAGRILPDGPDDEADAAERAKQEAWADRVHAWVEGAGVPYADAELIASGKLRETTAVRTVREWLSRKLYGSVLVLSGPRGCGKSVAASWCVTNGPPTTHPYRKWRPAETPMFVDVAELVAMSTFDRDGFGAIVNASVLALDDLGTEPLDDKGYFRSRFDAFWRARCRGVGWTVVTTNLPKREFLTRYGERVGDRLNEPGRGFVHLNEPSMRTKEDDHGRK